MTPAALIRRTDAAIDEIVDYRPLVPLRIAVGSPMVRMIRFLLEKRLEILSRIQRFLC